MMITGTIGQREVFLDQIKQLSVIKDLHVARSEAVVKTFGADTKSTRALDALEQQVMKEAKAYAEVDTDGDTPILRVITPTVASKNYLGKDCIACHQVPEGTSAAAQTLDALAQSLQTTVSRFKA